MSGVQDLPRRYCPICDHVVRREFAPGPGERPDASCPRCRSLERHRFLAVVLSVLRPVLDDVETVLEVAPSPETTPLLAGLGARRHVKIDLGADNRAVDLLGSLTALPLPDASVDLLVCYHVLEHVPDDAAAMREIARVLSPTGIGLLQVPFRPGTRTDEDPSATVEERVRRFGQADHVRYYGDDFETRLVDAGLRLQRMTPRSLLGPEASTWLHLVPDEMVWLVRRAAPGRDAAVPPPLVVDDTALSATLRATLGEVVRLRTALVQQRGEVARLRGLLAAAPPVEVPAARTVAGRALAGRAVRRLRQGAGSRRRRTGAA